MNFYRKIKAIVRAAHPIAFGKKRVPLQGSILRKLVKAHPDISRHQLYGFMKIWWESNKYKAVMLVGAKRVDLDGKETGSVVTPDQAVYYGNSPRPILHLKKTKPPSRGVEGLAESFPSGVDSIRR